MNSNETFHVAVIGGGLVGAATALALLRQGLRVALIEKHAASVPEETWDTRIYAISPASEDLLRDLGAWQRMDASRLQAVYRMDVQGDADGQLRFDAYESGVGRLATILESGRLQHALWQAIADVDEAALLCPAEIESIEWGMPVSTLHLSNGSLLRAELVIGADGARSRVRDMAGLTHTALPYQQHGVVANFACEIPHRGTAFQWFSDGDIVAYLPLSGHTNPHGLEPVADRSPLAGNRMSLVWSTSDSHAQALLALDTDAFVERVEEAGVRRLGKLQLLTKPAAFPLRLIRVEQAVAPGLALAGDAAHGIHPLAGQGVNLGFGDVAALREVLAGRGSARCGDERLLARYARQRAFPVMQMQGAMHGLYHVFNTSGAAWPRNMGMNILDHLGFAKSSLVREATRFSQ